MTVRWTVHVIHMLSIQHKTHKLNLTAKTYYDKFFLFNSFFFFISYNLRIIQEYFQPKLGRKIIIFSLVRKNNILIKKRVYMYEGCLRIHSLTQSITSIAEKILQLLVITHKRASNPKKKYSRNTVEQIRFVCVAVMKLVRSVFAHTERTALSRTIYISRLTYVWNICSWGLLKVTDLFISWDEYGSIKI